MSEPTPQPQKQRPVAEKPVDGNKAAGRIAATLKALAGPNWHQLRYGIAVSGGSDSMALLAMMGQTLPNQVWAATVDHGLRTGSADEANMVARWCGAHGIGHAILHPANPIFGSLQAAARAARYALLENWRRECALDFVLTAHHADDQLETMIMRLNRSSGVGGLAAIRAKQGHVLRPLLDWRRGELETWVHDHGIPFVTDPSNVDPRFDRARLRTMLAAQQILDVSAAARSAEWLNQADQALDWMVDQAIAAWPDSADLAIIRDHDYPDELLRRVIVRRLSAHDSALVLRGPALDSVMAAMRAGRRAMIGDLLIDRQSPTNTAVWRISAAPRRKKAAK